MPMWSVQSQSAGRTSVRAEALDLAELRDRASNDDELVVELLQDFLSRRSTTFDLKCACTRASFKELSRLAHRLKGTLLALGAKPAASAASAVEVIASGLIGTSEQTSEAPRLSALSGAVDVLCARLDETVSAMQSVVDVANAMTPRTDR